jgi:peptidoglycan/LPS O-acetylase OafA/YrhL
MTVTVSAYLDALRLILAIMVLLSHVSLVGGRLSALSGCGTQAVDGFFVLSGFVVAHVVSGRERCLRTYATARATRILSVSLPAIALTIVADQIGKSLDPSLYVGIIQPGQTGAITRSLVFLNEAWSHRFPGSDSPYWSLGFEVPYYIVFGLACCLRNRIGWVLAACVMACVGPQVALMLPVWLMGAASFAMAPMMSRRLGLFAATIGLLGVLALIVMGHEQPAFMLLREPIAGLGSLITHYIFGASVAIHLSGLNAATRHLEWTAADWVRRAIARTAGCTFSIYLYHIPLMFLTRAEFGPQLWLLIGLPLIGSMALAQVTERRKRWPLQMLALLARQKSFRPATL